VTVSEPLLSRGAGVGILEGVVWLHQHSHSGDDVKGFHSLTARTSRTNKFADDGVLCGQLIPCHRPKRVAIDKAFASSSTSKHRSAKARYCCQIICSSETIKLSRQIADSMSQSPSASSSQTRKYACGRLAFAQY
jgi:hypothetical protein